MSRESNLYLASRDSSGNNSLAGSKLTTMSRRSDDVMNLRLAKPKFAATWAPAVNCHGATSHGTTLFITELFAELAGSCRLSAKSESQTVGSCIAESDVSFVERMVKLSVTSVNGRYEALHPSHRC